MRRTLFLILFFPLSLFSFANELIIYRPQNSENINEVRCWIKIEDENGNDVTYSQATAAYAWMDRPNELHRYQKSFYLSGGMACHLYLNTRNGEKYRISVYTPKDHVENFPIAETLKTDWDSSVFEYDSSKVENSVDKRYNPLKVIFVAPMANDNGFYEPHWDIHSRAPKYFRFRDPQFTKPKTQNQSK